MDAIRGKVYVVGDHVDTDQIIPAEFLTYNPADSEERKYFGRYAMSGVPAESAGLPEGNVRFTPEDQFKSEYAMIIAGRNFGCGSSREHAPLAIAESGCQAVVAESFARIFYRNAVNGGYVVPFEGKQRLVDEFATGDEAEIDPQAGTVKNLKTGKEFILQPLGDVGPIIKAGGIFDYARQAGMIA
jgi:3-isopropylmalate/(R)-2-methylmalate dehydratase small subunit